MNKKIVKAIAFIICAAMLLTSFSFVFFLPTAFAGTEAKDKASTDYLNERVLFLRGYLELILKNYKDVIDYEQLTKGALDGITKSLQDPYSEYFPEKEDTDSFMETVLAEYVGLGITVQNSNDNKVIVEVNPDGPAYEAGILANDVIVMINGKDAKSLTLEEATKEMKGEEGTEAVLVIERNGERLTFKVERRQISIRNVSYEMKDENIGYIKISRIDDDIASEFKLAKIDLVNQGAEALIIDLRDNPGGAMEQAIDIADQLLPEGAEITHYIQQGEVIATRKATGKRTSEMPIVLLINENSASASEVIAGALKDNKAAVLVGTTTFGKGIAQGIEEFLTGESVKLSMFYFTTPNKNTIHKVGVSPDYVVKNVEEANPQNISLYESFAPMNEAVKPALGDTGLNVYGAQQRLQFLGYYAGELSGAMNESTAQALQKFQKDEGLYPYAVLDNTTRSKLEEAAYNKAYGVNAGKDLQLEKALELLK